MSPCKRLDILTSESRKGNRVAVVNAVVGNEVQTGTPLEVHVRDDGEYVVFPASGGYLGQVVIGVAARPLAEAEEIQFKIPGSTKDVKAGNEQSSAAIINRSDKMASDNLLVARVENALAALQPIVDSKVSTVDKARRITAAAVHDIAAAIKEYESDNDKILK